MKEIWTKYAPLLAIAATLGIGTPAAGCTINTPPQLAIVGQADLVFVGRFEEIGIFRWLESYGGIPLPYGLITFSVSETLRGESQPEWKILYWVNILGSGTRFDPEKTVIVAAFDGRDNIQSLIDAGAGGGLVTQASAYLIQEPACSSAPVFENNAGNRAAVDAILIKTQAGQ